ncbi:MAG TPA: hypothetical protein VMS09_06450 [Paenibacillus sp.]|nr:hypothetical protein [Paenibacillus sp.]HUC91660.1 hypothetical protein [Paenibacillus sp.]
MDKETQEGMKNLDATASAADIVKDAASRHKAEFSEQEQNIKISDNRE